MNEIKLKFLFIQVPFIYKFSINTLLYQKKTLKIFVLFLKQNFIEKLKNLKKYENHYFSYSIKR